MPLWHNIAELVNYYIPPLPSVYWIDITRECNLRCIMCPQSRGIAPRWRGCLSICSRASSTMCARTAP